ncbi:hypothetical protein [Rhizosphaericola mali]|uniref:Outer membrane beta-barrel protein n=1 Tax=Rhizosphaericola mali TaxID=2545455 RepID=A0A5P2G3E0_9BACT|nr:hypothetical protein [Rhizosphaericola mali]QES89717.1 hypothetical protein E0W69_013960 [Rhizosphaericola mali]
MKYFILSVAVLFFAHYSQAQSTYHQALGARFIGGTTISYKNYISDNNLEFQGSFWKHGFRFAGLYEFNYAIEGVDGLNFILGPGAHLGFWNKEYKDKKDAGTEFGIDGIIGLDYKIPSVPINLSVDWQPSIVLAGGSDFTPNMGGIGIRYTF